MLEVAVRLSRFWSGCLLCLLGVVNAEAATVRLAWDPVPEPDIAGYRILYGTQSGHYSGAIDVAQSTDFTITSLADGVYYFAVQAYTFNGWSSVPSNEIVASVGTPPLFVTGCATADPFAAMGGGSCYNGGWLAPGMAPPAGPTTVVSPPRSTPGACANADPFASMGGGSCYNGGWLAPGMAIPGGTTTPATSTPSTSTPPAPTSPTTCSTADPFTAMGGGTCYNGGWLPPGMPVPGGSPITAPPPSSSTPPPPTGPTTCSTADPFAAMGGGTCYRGGWLPPGMAVPSSGTVSPTASPGTPPPTNFVLGCATPDPFTAMGGGTCVNGGWLAPGMKGTTGVAHMTVTGTLQVLSVTDGLWLIAGDDGIFYASHAILPANLLIDGARVTFVGVMVTPAAPGTAAVVDILSIEFAGKLNR